MVIRCHAGVLIEIVSVPVNFAKIYSMIFSTFKSLKAYIKYQISQHITNMLIFGANVKLCSIL